MTDFQIISQGRGNSCLFKLVGRLSLSARSHLHDFVEKVWNDLPCLRLDLSAVNEVDLSGLSWLILADNHMRQRGARMEIVATSPPLRRALALLRPATRILNKRSAAKVKSQQRLRQAVKPSPSRRKEPPGRIL
ncbi:STAS domain-containing protein [bacterium]|nr:STAS domain-containing protein [bacterium]